MQLSFKLNAMLIKIPKGFFGRNWQADKIYMELLRTQNNQNNSGEKINLQDLQLSYFKSIMQQ